MSRKSADELMNLLGRRAARRYLRTGVLPSPGWDISETAHPDLRRLGEAWARAFDSIIPKPVFPPPIDRRLN